jgi:hypothetical protein
MIWSLGLDLPISRRTRLRNCLARGSNRHRFSLLAGVEAATSPTGKIVCSCFDRRGRPSAKRSGWKSSPPPQKSVRATRRDQLRLLHSRTQKAAGREGAELPATALYGGLARRADNPGTREPGARSLRTASGSRRRHRLALPLVQILDLEDTSVCEVRIDQLVAGSFQDVIWLTGEGLHRPAIR